MKTLTTYTKPFSVFWMIVLLPTLFLSGCNLSDSTEELSGDYFYRDEGPNTKDIISHLPNRKEIYSKILKYEYNSDFIIAIQKPIYEEYRLSVAFKLRNDKKKYPTNSQVEAEYSEKEADSILKHDAYYLSIFKNEINYWIIENKTKQLYGPLTKVEYEAMRKKLMIPERLQVKI